MHQRVALAVVLTRGKHAIERRRRLEHGLDFRDDEVAAVGFRRQNHQRLRRLVGDEVSDRTDEQRGEPDLHRLDQGHTLLARICDRVSDLALEGPELNCARKRRAFR